MRAQYANCHIGSWSKETAESIAKELDGQTSQKWHAYTFANMGTWGVGVESWNCTKTELKDMLIYYLASRMVGL